jgi:hypothetical protein
MHRRSQEQQRRHREQAVAQVEREMMGEEIDVDRHGERDRRLEGRVAAVAYVEDARDACEIRADGGVHET